MGSSSQGAAALSALLPLRQFEIKSGLWWGGGGHFDFALLLLLLPSLLLKNFRQLVVYLGFFSYQRFWKWRRNMTLLLLHGIHWMPASGTRINVSYMA